jgi:hypothetical protein
MPMDLEKYYASALARALRGGKLPSRATVAQIRLNVFMGIENHIKKRTTVIIPLRILLESSSYRRHRTRGLYLFFSNTDKYIAPLLQDVFKNYGFSLVRSGQNCFTFWSHFETKALPLKRCLTILRRMKRDGLISGLREEKVYQMEAIRVVSCRDPESAAR